MTVLRLIYFFIWYGLTLMLAAGAALVILRAIFDYREVNPFTWHYRNVRRATDGVLLPARAILRGRYNVSCEDVRAVAPAVLRHRVLLNFQAEAEKVDSDQVIRQLIETVPEPKSGL